MKSLWFNLGLIAAMGALAALVVSALPLEPGVRFSALVGLAVSTLVGHGALSLKVRLASLAPQGGAGVQALLVGMVVSFLLRLFVAGGGALALNAKPDRSPAAFLLAFFALYLAQQFLEVRTLLAARPAKPEVT